MSPDAAREVSRVQELLQTLDIADAVKHESEVLYLYVWSEGFVTHGKAKGFAFSGSPLHPTHASLDRKPQDKEYSYKALKNGWYIFYYWD